MPTPPTVDYTLYVLSGTCSTHRAMLVRMRVHTSAVSTSESKLPNPANPNPANKVCF